jgi:hypothetical protein
MPAPVSIQNKRSTPLTRAFTIGDPVGLLGAGTVAGVSGR